MIKKFAALIGAWVLYGIGHVISKLLYIDVDWVGETVYPVYNWFMLKSDIVQMWGGASGPWHEVEVAHDHE
jgi:hypothetical protein